MNSEEKLNKEWEDSLSLFSHVKKSLLWSFDITNPVAIQISMTMRPVEVKDRNGYVRSGYLEQLYKLFLWSCYSGFDDDLILMFNMFFSNLNSGKIIRNGIIKAWDNGKVNTIDVILNQYRESHKGTFLIDSDILLNFAPDPLPVVEKVYRFLKESDNCQPLTWRKTYPNMVTHDSDGYKNRYYPVSAAFAMDALMANNFTNFNFIYNNEPEVKKYKIPERYLPKIAWAVTDVKNRAEKLFPFLDLDGKISPSLIKDLKEILTILTNTPCGNYSDDEIVNMVKMMGVHCR